MRKVVFLDRDGVLNVDTNYLHKVEDLRWVKGAKTALKKAVDAGYDLIVVTNQSGVARGYYSERDVLTLHSYMGKVLEGVGAPILAFYYCPHLKGAPIAMYDIDCDCRKPKPGMLLKAIKDYDIDVTESFLIGDSPRDIQAAEAAGMKGYLFISHNLEECMDAILEKRKTIQ